MSKLLIDRFALERIVYHARRMFDDKYPQAITDSKEIQAYLFIAAFDEFLHENGIDPQFEVDYVNLINRKR